MFSSSYRCERQVLLNAIVRIPPSAIQKTFEDFHGINKDMVKNRLSFNAARRTVFELCKKADKIIMTNPEGDFEAL